VRTTIDQSVSSARTTAFQQEGRASYREILDTSNWDRSLVINTPGQSGSRAARTTRIYCRCGTKINFPLLYSRETVDREAKDPASGATIASDLTGTRVTPFEIHQSTGAVTIVSPFRRLANNARSG
jgi:hypothetical protein